VLCACSEYVKEGEMAMKRNWIVLVFVACTVIIAGCASSIRNDGAKLAKDGYEASIQMRQTVIISEDDMKQKMMPAVAFSVAYEGASQEKSDENIKTLRALIDALSTTREMLKSLSAAYTSFGELAQYDASAEFDKSFGDFTDKTDAMLAVVAKGTQIPGDVKAGVRKAGSFAIGVLQDKYIKDSSKDIKNVLLYVVGVLEKPSIRDGFIASVSNVQKNIDWAALQIWNSKLYSYTPLLDALGEPLGLKSVKNADELVSGKEKVLRGLKAVVDMRVKAQLALIPKAYDDNVAALKKLIKSHAELENRPYVKL